MRLMRVLAIAAIAGLLGAGVLIDLADRPQSDSAERHTSALAAPTAAVNTWFCPGGSGPSQVAELTVQIANGSDDPRTVTVSVLPGRFESEPSGGSAMLEPAVIPMLVEPRDRVLLRPAEVLTRTATSESAASGPQWAGVTVEAEGSDVIVEQILTGSQGGVGRSPCLTRVADSWTISNGATRSAVEGERFVVMLLNPFPDAAVADIELVADVGRDSIDGLVIPAQRVVAVDVTNEVTVAATVAAFINVVSGRVAASWIQIADGPLAGQGTRTAPAVAGAADQWHLPVAAVGAGRRDVVAVSNPSPDEVAEVDLEIIAEDPAVEVSPIEVTVRPGRTVLVDLSEQGRLEGIGAFSVVVRSLAAVPVTASIISASSTVDPAGAATAAAVADSTAASGVDSASRRWIVTAEVPVSDGGDGSGTAAGALVIVNPSAEGIAAVNVSVDGEPVCSTEIGPGRNRRLSLAWLASRAENRCPVEADPPLLSLDSERYAAGFLVEVDSSSPVVVGRELLGLTSRSAALGVAVEEPVPLSALR